MAKNTNGAAVLTASDADLEAWLVECAAIKCRIDENAVWAFSAGRLFTVAPIPGFAALPANSRRLVAAMAMQYLPTRVGQTAGGDLSEEVAKAIAAPDDYFSVRDKDAYEASYEAYIAELVDKKKGWDVAKLSKEEKADRAVVIKDTAEVPAHREQFFGAAVEAAKEAGRSVVKERKRTPKAATESKSLSLL